MTNDVATPRIIEINRRTSRCNDVIDITEASFAVRPLRVSCIRRETLDWDGKEQCSPSEEPEHQKKYMLGAKEAGQGASYLEDVVT